MTEPLVSVGIPTYNRPEGLRRTLECIVGQTYRNLEIIISDNCSPNPDVEQVIRSFMVQDARIHYFRQPENKGASFNFEFVLAQATGDYFMWAADDDYLESASLIHELMRFAPDHVLTFSNFILSTNSDRNFFSDAYGNCRTDLDYLFAWLNNGNGQPVYGIYNLQLLKKFRIAFEFDTDLSYFGEGTFLHKLFINGRIKFVPDQYIYYYDQNSAKISNVILCADFTKYFLRTRKIYKNSSLPKSVKKKSQKIINSKYSNYLYSLFLCLERKEKIMFFHQIQVMPDIFILLIIKYARKVFMKFISQRQAIRWIKKIEKL